MVFPSGFLHHTFMVFLYLLKRPVSIIDPVHGWPFSVHDLLSALRAVKAFWNFSLSFLGGR